MNESDTQDDVIDIVTEEKNDLFFKINIEGPASGTAKARLFCESDDVSYAFSGYATEGDVVQFTIPKGKLPPDKYKSSIEVFIENKYFLPVEFTLNAVKPVQVTAESVKVQKKTLSETIKVSAHVEKKPEPKQTTVIVEKSQPKFKTLKEKFSAK